MLKSAFSFLSIILIMAACGGVVGNIEKYRFPGYSMNEVKGAVQNVYRKKPEMRYLDTMKYKDKQKTRIDGDYYILIEDNNEKYLFVYCYPALVPNYDTTVEIALLTGANYGEDLNLAKDISFSEKRKYKKLFERYFIEEVRKELKR
jgi:phage anti-repressor protein